MTMEDSPNHSDRPRHWPVALVAVATLVVFAPLCGHEFTWWDDWATVHKNPHLNPPSWRGIAHYWTNVAYGLYAPMTYTVWSALAVVARLEQPDPHGIQLNPWIFHTANVLVHVVSACAAFTLLKRLVNHDLAACCGALLFALHPVQVETVGWISGMKDLLAGCLGLTALWQFVVAEQRGCLWRYLLLATAALVFAMLSKPSALVVPLIALLLKNVLSTFPKKELSTFSKKCTYTLFFWLALAAGVAGVARWAQDVTGIPRAPLWARPLIAGDTYAFYLQKVLFPLKLGVDYGRRPDVVLQQASVYLAWLVPVIVAAAVFSLRKRFPWLLASALIFFLSLLPVSGLFAFQFQFTSTVADHYLYFAMIAPAMALAFAMRNLAGSRSAWTIAGILLFLLAVRSVAQTAVWKNDRTLFSHALTVNPNSFVARNNLGHALHLEGNLEDALEQFQIAARLNDRYPSPHENMAGIFIQQGRMDEAIDAIERSIEIRARLPRTLYPNYMEDHDRVGQVLMRRGRYDEAIAHFETLLKIKPDHAAAREHLNEAHSKKSTAPTAPAR
jgi:hypothetical protein